MAKANLIISASHWQDVNPEEWPAKFFTPEECADSIDGSIMVDRAALLAMDEVRRELNMPIRVNSWYRSKEHDAAIGGSGGHTTGKSIDVGISHGPALLFIRIACAFGFTGIGVKQNGPIKSRFVHVDMMPNTKSRPRPTIWSY